MGDIHVIFLKIHVFSINLECLDQPGVQSTCAAVMSSGLNKQLTLLKLNSNFSVGVLLGGWGCRLEGGHPPKYIGGETLNTHKYI